MRVGILCEFSTLNGGEHSLLSVLDVLRHEWKGGVAVEPAVLAPSRGPLAAALTSRGISHVPFDVRAFGGALRNRDELLAELHTIARERKFQLIHANSLSMGRLTGVMSLYHGVRTTCHVRDIVRLSKNAISELNSNHQLVAVSDATRRHHIAQGLHADRVTTIHNGVDLERFVPRPRTGELRRSLGLSEETILAATIGQIGMRKGQDLLVEAAKRFLPHNPQLHCLIVGERYSQKEESVQFESDLKSKLKDAGLAKQFHFLGYRIDVASLLSELDLVIHPARQEPLGRVLLESAASGVAIVASRVGGTEEILDEGCAELVPENDPESLAAAAIRFLKEPELRQRLGNAARRRAVERFDVQRAARKLAEFWRNVLLGAHAGSEDALHPGNTKSPDHEK